MKNACVLLAIVLIITINACKKNTDAPNYGNWSLGGSNYNAFIFGIIPGTSPNLQFTTDTSASPACVANFFYSLPNFPTVSGSYAIDTVKTGPCFRIFIIKGFQYYGSERSSQKVTINQTGNGAYAISVPSIFLYQFDSAGHVNLSDSIGFTANLRYTN